MFRARGAKSQSEGKGIDAHARKIVGWRGNMTAHAGFVLDALGQAVHVRRPVKAWGWLTMATTAASICR